MCSTADCGGWKFTDRTKVTCCSKCKAEFPTTTTPPTIPTPDYAEDSIIASTVAHLMTHEKGNPLIKTLVAFLKAGFVPPPPVLEEAPAKDEVPEKTLTQVESARQNQIVNKIYEKAEKAVRHNLTLLEQTKIKLAELVAKDIKLREELAVALANVSKQLTAHIALDIVATPIPVRPKETAAAAPKAAVAESQQSAAIDLKIREVAKSLKAANKERAIALSNKFSVLVEHSDSDMPTPKKGPASEVSSNSFNDSLDDLDTMDIDAIGDPDDPDDAEAQARVDAHLQFVQHKLKAAEEKSYNELQKSFKRVEKTKSKHDAGQTKRQVIQKKCEAKIASRKPKASSLTAAAKGSSLPAAAKGPTLAEAEQLVKDTDEKAKKAAKDAEEKAARDRAAATSQS